MLSYAVAAALLGLASSAHAQVSSQCAGDVCFGLNIPDTTASSGNGDIYFQITAPTTYSWVALGQGSSMSGSHIFVMYTSADGNNVTISPRLGTGHEMPEFDSNTQVTLLGGSGVSGGNMKANVKCSNCQSWSGGMMDFAASSGTWIHAARSGSPLDSDDTSETIQEHGEAYGSFNWNFSSAKGGSSVNPFLSSTSTASGTQNCVPRPSGTSSSGTSSSGFTGFGGRPTARPTGSPWSGNNNKREEEVNYCDPGESSSGSSGNAGQIGGFAAQFERERNMLIAHGVLASLAFVIFFPAGAISIRLFSFPGLVWFHAAVQIFSYILYIAAFGIGVYLATNEDYLKDYHPIIGIVVFVLLFFQPIFGFLHHALFKKHGGRTFWSHAHLWLGRILITLGMINGGLGLLLAGDAGKSAYIAYGVVAAFVWLVYVAAAVYGEMKRKRSGPSLAYGQQPRKGSGQSTGRPSAGEQREYYGGAKANGA